MDSTQIFTDQKIEYLLLLTVYSFPLLLCYFVTLSLSTGTGNQSHLQFIFIFFLILLFFLYFVNNLKIF